MFPDYASTRIESVRLAKNLLFGLTREQVGPRRLGKSYPGPQGRAQFEWVHPRGWARERYEVSQATPEC